jgi:hypothetical protein
VLDKHISIVHKFPVSIPHEVTPQGLLLSRKNELFLIKDLNRPVPEKIGYIPWQDLNIFGHFRTIDRLYKISIQQAVWLPEHGYLLYNRLGWWLLRYGETKSQKLPTPEVGRPMVWSVCNAPNSGILFTEYFSNYSRQGVKIYRTTNLVDYEIAFEFPTLSVRHIHAIIQDPYEDKRVWVLTGDYDHESLFHYTEDNFHNLTSLPCLGQRTRATSLCFHGNPRLIWGMDSPLPSPSILQWGPDYTQEPDPIATLPGPAYYMAVNAAGGMYLGTTVEPGPAVSSSSATLWAATKEAVWKQIGKFKSDVFPQYAIIYFPKGKLPENFLVFSLRATQKDEGKIVIARDLSLS